jgi:uncharacterized protein (TIGR03437 family)
MRWATCMIAFCLLTPSLSAQRAALFSALLGGSGQDYATSVASDAQGNIYVVGLTYSNDFPVTPETYQTKFGGTCDAFVAKLGSDGKLLWSTYLGGILDDWATGVALDSAGNVLVTGYTRSANFPLANPIQSALDNNATDDYDAFVAKLDPNGAKLLYSTFLGGQADDGAAGITVDSAGNAYVAVSSNSAVAFPGAPNAASQSGIFVGKLSPQGALVYSFYHPYGSAGAIALDAAGATYVAGLVASVNPSSATQVFGPLGSAYAIAFKISPDGSKEVYETAIGGSVQTNAAAIAVNAAGEAYVAGSTSSVDFPLVHPLQTSPGARPLFESTDSGTTWAPIDDLPFALPQMLVADPATPTTVYAASGDLGVFKSLDGGATWAHANNGIAGTNVKALAIDPLHPQTLYAATAAAVYKSTDGAITWSAIDSPPFPVSQLAVDAQSNNIIYEVGTNIRKSLDGGATWNAVAFPGTVASMTLDPRVSGHLFAVSNMVFCGIFCGNNQPAYLYRSVDAGATWIQVPLTSAAQAALTVDASTNPSTIYNGLYSRSVDGGITWSSIAALPFASSDVSAFAVDPVGNLYVAVSGTKMFLSRDHGQTWTNIGSPTSPAAPETFSPSVIAIVPAGSSGTVYAALLQVATSGFVSKLSADGSALEYSTYLRGHASTQPFPIFAAEPGIMQNQNWISSIALDASGNIVVAGGTRAMDFLTANPAQATSAGHADAFAATISADGGKLDYSTYFGGSGDDGGLAVGLDSNGNTILVGQTWSSDFPASVPVQPPFGYGDAFVVKLATAPPSIAAVLNGAGYQPGIAAESWVTIKGINLANSIRTWASSDIVNGGLPTSLDGVSVAIGGKPAFVEYVSPTQINVQAPSDSAVGTVNVVVDNNGALSAPAIAQLHAVAPAFFLFGATNYAAANLLPGYAPVADPSVVPGAVAAKPGDTLVLWGTGFGATDPLVAAGVEVSGAPIVVAPVTVTVGGAPAQVISEVLAPGAAGLYQVTIQLPANLPTGAAAVQASVGGVLTPAGVTTFLFVR